MAETMGLPSGWEETTLGELGTFYRGHGGTREDEIPHGVPCVRYGDLYTHHDFIIRSFASFIKPGSISGYFPLRFGDVVFAGSGETFEEIGKAAVYCDQAPAFAGGDTIIFRPSPKLDPCFAGYAVNGLIANTHKSRHGQGSSVIHIGAGHLAGLPINLPPLGVQQRLAHYLQTIDQAIEKTEALIEKYQQLKAGLMHDLFTRGIGPDGKLRPPRAQAPELYQETSIGWIPKEWTLDHLESLLAPVANNLRSGPFGSSLLKSELVEDGVPFLGIDNIFVERFEPVFRRYVSEKKFVELSRYSVRGRDVVITIMGTVGRCAVIPVDIGRALSSKHLWTMTLDQDRVVPELVCWQLNFAPWVKSWLRRETQGGIMDAIQSKTLKSLKFPVPPLTEQNEILDRYERISERIDRESVTLAKLLKEKSGLMHDLLTGKVRVNPDPPEPANA